MCYRLLLFCLSILLTNKENCALKLVDEIIIYYDARSKNIKLLNKYVVLNVKAIVLRLSKSLDYDLDVRRTVARFVAGKIQFIFSKL